jgi:hypothetical protein
MGSTVALWFVLEDTGTVIETSAVVRWAAADGVGIQFGSLRARDAWALGQFLRLHAR